MTRAEMTKIFAAMLLVYPRAESFKGGIAALKPTIELWTRTLPDVDYWTGEQALYRIFRECKFPPTPAEFLAAANSVKSEISGHLSEAKSYIRMLADLEDCSMEECYAKLHPENLSRQAIDAIGGPDKLLIPHESSGGVSYTWNWDAFDTAYEAILRKEISLPGNGQKALPGV